MSDRNRTPEEYIQLYARDKKISVEAAKSHIIVREVVEELEKE